MPSYIELDKQSSFPASSNVGKEILGINSSGILQLTDSNGVSTNVSGEAIKKYVAKLQEVSNDYLYSGLLKVGEIYRITDYQGDNFSNIAYIISGVINENGCYFVATGTTPTNWTNGSELQVLGNPYAISPLVNTLGYTNPVFWSQAYNTTGKYFLNFPEAVDPSKVTATLTPTSLNNVNSFITYANNTTEDHLFEYWYNYVANDTITALSVQSNGKIIVGGGFTSYNGNTRKYLIRIYSSGIEDATFYTNLTSTGDGSGFNSSVITTAIQSDGKILVVGVFGSLNGNSRIYLVRLNSDGTEDTTFYTNLTSTGDNSGFFGDIVNTVAIQSDGKILVGGFFSTLNGNSRNSLVRLNSDGTEDTTFYTNLTSTGDSSGFNNYIRTISVQSDGKILVGGDFTTLNGNSRNSLVRLNSDGTEDITFYTNLTSTGDGSGFNNSLYTTAIQSDGKILVGGSFSRLNSNSNYQYLCRLNSTGVVDSTYIIKPNSIVYVMTVEPSDILMVGGQFSNVKDGAISTDKCIARIDVNGNIINDFANTSMGGGGGAGVYALAQQGYNRIMIGISDYNYIYNIYSGYDIFLNVYDKDNNISTILNNIPIEISKYS